MSTLINTIGLQTTDILDKYPKGEFRVITKNRHTGMGCHNLRDFENERYCENPSNILAMYKKGALQTIEFKPEGSDYWFRVFSRTGKKIHMIDQKMLLGLTVGTINSMWFNTELYNHRQYQAVNSATWASYAFQMNEPKYETVRVA
jgi:hypothetical protein